MKHNFEVYETAGLPSPKVLEDLENEGWEVFAIVAKPVQPPVSPKLMFKHPGYAVYVRKPFLLTAPDGGPAMTEATG